MTAEDAFKLTMESLPKIECDELNEIYRLIETIAKRGKFQFTMSSLPSENVMKILQAEHYRFYSSKGFVLFPHLYTITWGPEEKRPKKKLYTALLQMSPK